MGCNLLGEIKLAGGLLHSIQISCGSAQSGTRGRATLWHKPLGAERELYTYKPSKRS